jgi:TPR repeat protein
MRIVNIEELLLILFLFTGLLFIGCEKNETDKLDNRCAESDLLSCFKLGSYYENENNKQKAKSYYLLACSKSVTKACYKLGLLSIEEGNQLKADKFFKLCCDYGDLDCCEKKK